MRTDRRKRDPRPLPIVKSPTITSTIELDELANMMRESDPHHDFGSEEWRARHGFDEMLDATPRYREWIKRSIVLCKAATRSMWSRRPKI